MSEYELAKDVVALTNEVNRLTALMEQAYAILDHNIKLKKLEEPKPAKE